MFANINSFDVVTLVLMCVSIFAAVYFNNRKIRTENEKRLDDKADIDYVDKQDRAMHRRITELRDNNENDRREIMEMLKEIRQYIIMDKK